MFEPIFYGWLFSSALLIAQHVGLWEQPWRVEAPWSYILGVSSILAGCFIWSRTIQIPITPFDALVAFALISTSGVWVLLGYAVRARLARKHKAHELKADTIRLTQDLIDGGNHATRQSRDPNRVREN